LTKFLSEFSLKTEKSGAEKTKQKNSLNPALLQGFKAVNVGAEGGT